ncbi:arginase family protein [Nakamurella sp. A5-74]|uniref:Arginase family protein n=1 Tax=Nakamurella sp. A5-74 TaxID=3158264 RepID=A0AAU8DRV8_9ACTN
MSNPRVNVLGVPNSAGAYCVGVERAPAVVRDAGLIEALTAAGCEVHDHGDLTERLWVPDRSNRYAQNLDDEVAATLELAEAASNFLSAEAKLLVLGGSCVVAVGMCAALARLGQSPRLIYIDRHLDLNTPHSTTEGSLSWMGMAHALDLEGAAPELAGVAGGTPLLDRSDLVYLGVDLSRETTEWERDQADSLGLTLVDQQVLCNDPGQAAREARNSLGPGAFVVHLDVDVLDFLDAPIAENVNGRNSGPTIEQLGQALAELLPDPDCWGITIGQLDPAHAAADPTAVPRLVAALASALTAPRQG